jgi:geranylgeranyl diphosphate synthase type I
VGQYLDLAHEKAENVTMADYFEMVKGKTGALFAVCFKLGALIAGKKPTELTKLFDLGEKFGMAFQMQDDYLGIWGQHGFTGKSVTGDLFNRKKTFPVHYALDNLPEARDYWLKHKTFTLTDLAWFKNCLENGAVDKLTLAEIERNYADCTAQLSFLLQRSKNANELFQLINSLFERNS